MSFLVFRQKLLVVIQVALQQSRRIQTIRTLGLAFAAMPALLDLRHLRLSCGRQMAGGRGTSQKQRHACAVVDFYSSGAWHAVAATTTEFARQFLPIRIDDSLQLRVHRRWVVIIT